MSNRRDFIKKTTLGTLAISSVLGVSGFAANHENEPETEEKEKNRQNQLLFRHGTMVCLPIKNLGKI
nr:twin-arginine translocation signal domain-containing protein [Flavobacterium anhuiense]